MPYCCSVEVSTNFCPHCGVQIFEGARISLLKMLTTKRRLVATTHRKYEQALNSYKEQKMSEAAIEAQEISTLKMYVKRVEIDQWIDLVKKIPLEGESNAAG